MLDSQLEFNTGDIIRREIHKDYSLHLQPLCYLFTFNQKKQLVIVT